MQKDTVTAIDSLEEEYSPPPPGKEDCRYSKVALLCQRHSTFGVYHLAYWMQKGHTFTPPTLSRHIGSAGYKQQAVGAFFNNISQLIQVIGMLFLVIDPDCYLRYWRLFQEDCSNNVPCSLLNTSRHACFLWTCFIAEYSS
ncbi:hypothetical protein BDZ91DRAFT_260610 [Kalaharituber pfeilii]|nr:hypothetical protein BDZ91DRAFT_260610 [Kalaharituber pfeilii]